MSEDGMQKTNEFTTITFNNIVKLGHKDMLHKDVFTVSWILGRFCNYRCSYCWPYANSPKKDHRPTELCLSTINEIKRQARENGFDSFHFSLSGGEPTFHPGFLDIVKHLASDTGNYHSLHMTSNCSQPIKWFEKFVSYVKPFHATYVTASFHREHVDTEDKVSQFADKLIFLQENGVFVTINIVMIPQHFYSLYQSAQYFRRRGLYVTLKPQSNDTATAVVEGYTDDMLDKMKEELPWNEEDYQIEMFDHEGNKYLFDQAERFNAYGFNNFYGWLCNSGYQSIIIREPDGSIKRSYSCQDQPLGFIDKGFKLFDQPVICITKSCVSSADSKIPKRKI